MLQSLVSKKFSTLAKISPVFMAHSLVRSAIKNPKNAVKSAIKYGLPIPYAISKYAAKNPEKAVKAAKTVAKTVAPIQFSVAKFAADNQENIVKAGKAVAKVVSDNKGAIVGTAKTAAKCLCPFLNLLI